MWKTNYTQASSNINNYLPFSTLLSKLIVQFCSDVFLHSYKHTWPHGPVVLCTRGMTTRLAVYSQPKIQVPLNSVAKTWLRFSQRSAGAERLFHKRALSQTAAHYGTFIMMWTTLSETQEWLIFKKAVSFTEGNGFYFTRRNEHTHPFVSSCQTAGPVSWSVPFCPQTQTWTVSPELLSSLLSFCSQNICCATMTRPYYNVSELCLDFKDYRASPKGQTVQQATIHLWRYHSSQGPLYNQDVFLHKPTSYITNEFLFITGTSVDN